MSVQPAPLSVAPSPPPGRPLHVVQVSLDTDLLDRGRGAEPRARQTAYARELDRQRPGSQMTILVLTRSRGSPGLDHGNLRVVPVYGRLRGWPRLLHALAALHRASSIDVVTTQRVYAEAWVVLLFAWWHSVRVVGQVHHPFALDGGGGRPRTAVLGAAAAWATRRTLRYFAALRVVGHGLKTRILDQCLHHRVEVVPVPVAHLAAPVSAAPVHERPPTMLYVGRLCGFKDVGTWLEVAARVAREVPEARFSIVGDGPERDALVLRAAALGLGDRIAFHGFVPSPRLGEHYAGASVFLHTSRAEGFGRVVAEAYAFATPVVATRVTGVEDIVADGETGFLRAPGDADGLAAGVIRLLRDAGLRRRMGEAGRARVLASFAPGALRERWIGLLVAAAREDMGALALPRRRTFARWRRLAASPYSLLRTLQYEAIDGLRLAGRTLDLGGGARNSYARLLRATGRIESVNVDREIQPTLVHDLDTPLPLRDGTYDNVISFNTFEHLRHDTLAIAEAIRVLKPGGEFHFLVPWLYRVHGSPYDFHRHTWLWWRDTLEALGVDGRALHVEPLVWSRLATASSFFGSSRPGRALRSLLLLPAVLHDLCARDHRLRDDGRSRRLCDYALGYYVHGRK